MSVGIVIVWLVVAAVATVLGRLGGGSYDRRAPWVLLFGLALAGAVVGGLIGAALGGDNPAGTFAGAVIMAGLAIAGRTALARQHADRRT